MADNLPAQMKPETGTLGSLERREGCLKGCAVWSGSHVRGLRFVLSAWDAVEGHPDF